MSETTIPKDLVTVVTTALKDSKILKQVTEALKTDASTAIQALLDGTWKDKLPTLVSGIKDELWDKLRAELATLVKTPGDTIKNIQTFAETVNSVIADLKPKVTQVTADVNQLSTKLNGGMIPISVKELETTKRKSFMAGLILGLLLGISAVAAVIAWIIGK